MPDVLLSETINMELGAQEPWPQMITLYQPYEVEQILLHDNANCLAVQAFLKMCGLEFQVEPRSNAEYMSPTGRVPFIKCGAFTVSEFESIVTFIGNKGTSLSEHLDSCDKADLRAYISLVNNVFVNAELYICWIHEPTLNAVTKPRHGSVYPWPLNHFLNWKKQRQVIKKLNVLGWYNKTLDEVFSEVKNCCMALSERLDNNDYFFGEKPTELDALVYGHIYTIIVSCYPVFQQLTVTIRRFPQLIEHVRKIREYFFIQNQHSFGDDFEIIESPSKNSMWDFTESLESLPPLSESSFTLNPNELDALVFGHIFTIITTPLPNNELANIVKSFPPLVKLCKRIETRYFQRSED